MSSSLSAIREIAPDVEYTGIFFRANARAAPSGYITGHPVALSGWPVEHPDNGWASGRNIYTIQPADSANATARDLVLPGTGTLASA